MSSQATGKSLTDCPSNLKEAIDWILRVTGKDGGGGSGGTEQLATAVTDLINTAGVKNINPKITIEKILIDNLATGLATFIGYSGTNGIKSGSYKSTYGVGARWQYLQLNDGAQKCAKIFLGCLPMIFSALSYLYWRCSQPMNHGGWNEMTLGGGNGFSLRYFMESIGYNGVTDLDMTKNGSKIEGSAFSGLTEFNGAMTKATTPHPPPPSNCAYATFTKQLREEVSSQNNYDNHTLSALFICASSYFRWQQTKNAKLAYQSPSSIREMLYFLAALPYSTVYDEFDKYITSHFRTLLNKPSDTDENLKLDVADSSKTSSGGNDTLSAAELKQYLLTSCSFSAVVLGRFQGSGKAEKDSDDPWLYKLFCNSEFTFNFPSAPVLFSKFSHYTYALQFQLYFLYTQCAGTYTQERGWNQCQYGAKINASGNLVESHICRGFTCDDPSVCKHGYNDQRSGSSCTHNKKGEGCGQNTNASPLQAFLTDNLQGFTHSLPDSPSHLDDHPPGSMCHVKMGFKPQHLRSKARRGNYIYRVLEPFCGNSHSPLRQLCEKLGCLTKRTPRTLGDLFGFVWHLNGQLFRDKRPTLADLADRLVKGLNQTKSNVPAFMLKLLESKFSTSSGPSGVATPTVLSRSLESMAPAIPFLYQLFMADDINFLPGVLFDLTQHCHRKDTGGSISNNILHQSPSNSLHISGHQCSEPSDLWSLYNPVYSDTQHTACRNKNCGGYLEPLTFTYGATFSQYSAPAYFSWMAYLTDDLHEWFSEMLDEFRNISCDHCNSRCPKGKSCHYTSGSGCSCPSVVACAGVLPLLYNHGFQFHDAFSLKDTSTKRSCLKFSQQLSNVLSPDAPLHNLLLAIDEFLYMFRFYFFYNLSTFWLCSLAILLYFIFYGIDAMHIQSHVHLPSSHYATNWAAHHRQSSGTNEAHILHAVTKVSAIWRTMRPYFKRRKCHRTQYIF